MSVKFSIIVIILALLVVAGFFYRSYFQKNQVLSSQEAGEKAIAFINQNLLPQGFEASLLDVSEKSGLYKIRLKIGEKEFDSYISKDGQLFFQQGINLEKLEKKPQVAAEKQEKKSSCEDFSKTEEPLLEAFVVSQCPYGLQMQRILSRLVKKIPSLKDYLKVEYLGSIEDDQVKSMHGKAEAEENLRQICLREEQADSFWPYLDCHLKAGKVDDCLREARVDENKLEGCLQERGKEYAKKDFEAQDRYGVSGSPTLILNGEIVDEQGFAKAAELSIRSAEVVKQLLCCGFKEAPEFCSQELSREQAATGLSPDYTLSSGNSSGGECR